MKRQLLLVLVLFPFIACFSQNKADLLYNQGIEAYNTKDYNKAIDLFSQCEKLNTSSNRQMPYYSCNATAFSAHIFYLMGDTTKAKEISMEYPVEPVDQRRTIMSDSIAIKAIYAFKNEDWKNAKKFFLKCAELEEEELGSNHYYLANSLLWAANSASEEGDYYESARLFEKALSIYKTTNNYCMAYDAFLGYCFGLGDYTNYDDRISYCDDFIKNYSKCEIKDSICGIYRTFLYSVERYYINQSDYNKGFDIANKIIETFDNTSYNENDYYKSLENIAFLYRDLNYYEDAANIFKIILEKRKTNRQELTIEFAGDLGLLAGCYFNMNQIEKALDCLKQSINILEKIAPESTEYAHLLGTYASFIRLKNGDKENAKAYYEKAKKIMEKNDSSGFAYASLLSQMLSYYSELEDWDNVRLCYQKAKDIYNSNEDISSGYINMLFNYMACCFISNNHEEVIHLEKEWFDLYTKENINAFGFLREDQRNSFYIPIQFYGYFPILLCTGIDHPDIRRYAYNSILFSKGILLSSTINFGNFVYETHNDFIIKKYEQIKDLRRLENAKGFEKTYHLDLTNHIDSLEESLIYELKKYGDYTAKLDIKYNQISANLSEDEIAIEFATTGGGLDDYLIALVLKKDWDDPLCVILGYQRDFVKYLSNNSTNIDNTYNSKELSIKIWDDIINYAHIKEGDNIYFSPDGIIYQLGIEYLPADDGRIMSEKYNIRRLSSTKELCFRENRPPYTSATLYGGLSYDINLIEMKDESSRYVSNLDITTDRVEKKLIDGMERTDRWGLTPLPASLLEVDRIEEILTENNQKVIKYTDVKGNEESFKALSGNSPHVLHIATHGIFIKKTKEEIESELYLKSFIGLDDKTKVIDYSMSRTSLALAGAMLALNKREIPEGVEDGLLTAKEISQLDLRNVDLAVLSACETGLGDITSDGVAGLQRGFKNAGAKSIVMSLWKVNDEATQLLMTEFYKNLMNGKTKSESLKEAQRYLRDYEQDGEKIFSSPLYWASFILLDGLN